MKKLFTALTLILFAATAQAADLKVTVISIPDGATITASNKTGPSPALFTYALPKKWTECITIPGVNAQWISGAFVTFTFTACPKDGKDRSFYVNRPANVAKVELDLQYAAQLHQEAAARRAAIAQDDAARAKARKANLDAMTPLPPAPSVNLSIPKPPPVVNCTSQTIGGITNTRCQ